MVLNDKVYNFLKKLVQVYLPALATLYFSIAQIWGFPNTEDILGTATAIITCLGVILGISSKSYAKSDTSYDGVINVSETDDKKTFSLVLNTDPDSLTSRPSVTLKVNTPS